MFPLPKGAVRICVVTFFVSLFFHEISSEGRIVCYYTNWSVYRPGTAKFNPQNINPYLCTHLIYAFGGFTKDNTLKPFDKYQDIEQGGYSKFTGLKTYNKNLKTLLAIGGWNEGSSRFSPLVASPERRHQFIKNILKFLRQNHFDGLDLDWEYPAFRDGGKPRDKENYAQFVQELRSEFDRESSKTGRSRLLLTMAVPAGVEYIDKGYDIPKLNKYLDWFNILSYDYHSAYEPSANHHSPLFSLEEESEYNFDGDLYIDYTVKFYLNAGADRDKLVLGIPTYGRTYTLVNEDSTDIGAPADGPGEQGDATREKGYLAYYEICQNLRDDPDWTVIQPNPNAMGPYAYRGNQWVGYDDESIVKKKAEFVVDNDLGGIMFWSIDNDDFRGACGGKPYPLIEAAKEAMLERLGVGDNEVTRSSRPRKPQRSRSRKGSSNRNNIINDSSTNKIRDSSKKQSARRTSNKKTVSRSTTSTTTPPSTSGSLYIGGRTTTPPPPTTPDPGADFKCVDEGFFPHPRDCKKYFWCLDSGPSDLGIVAHQFTCPSGLYFNTAADSCDFARNVPCKTKTATTAKTTKAPTTTTSTTTTTTTNSPRITAATSRQTFLRYSSTTTAAPESEEDDYEIDDNDENLKEDEEEDPKVIKELIQLIKKVGGLEELEKQLLQQEDGTMVIKNSKTEQVSTTPSTISKSLYHKVLSKPNNLSSFRRQFEGALSRNAAKSQSASEDAAVEEESEKKSSNKYSSSIRNSRPSPQNAGIEKLAEFEGFLKEKPKYVTITRTRPTAAVSENHFDDDDDEEEVEETSTEEVEDKLRSSKIGRFENSAQLPISTLSYVDIRRSRPQPTTEGYEDDDSVEDDKIISTTSRSSYKSLNRRRLSTIAPTEEPSTTVKSSTINRYKKIERTRPSTISVDDSKGSTISNRDSFTVEDDGPPVTVQFLDVKDYTTHSPTQKSITTRIYESKGILSTRQVATVTQTSTISQPTTITTTTSPTTLRESTTNNPTTNNHLLNSPTISEETLSSVDKFPTQITISPVTEPLPSVPTLPVSNTEGNDNTTVITDKTTDESHQNSKDEVTMTDSKVEANGTSSTQSKINLTKHSEVKSSLKGTNINLSKLENTVTVTNTDKLTTLQKIDVDKSTTTTTTQTIDSTSKEFLGTVSSPRPFGFPRRRTRPTIARKPFSTTNQESVNNTFTTPPTQKQRRQDARRPVLSVRRRITTATNSPTESAISTVDSLTSAVPATTGNTKYRRRTKPTYLTSSTITPTTTTTLDTTKAVQKLVIRSKFGRPTGITRRITASATATDAPAAPSEEPIRTPNPLFKRRFTVTTVAPKTDSPVTQVEDIATETVEGLTESTDEVDQEAKSSIQDNKFTKQRYNQIGETLEDDLVDAIKAISKAPVPAVINTTPQYVKKSTIIGKNTTEDSKYILNRRDGATFTRKTIVRRPLKSTVPTTKPRTARVSRRKPKKPETFEKIINTKQYSGRTYRPFEDYDYYDDDDVRVIGKTSAQVKVILHGPGIIECLDQGNFPHPLSCRKFISCAKMETGGVVGWEYTCPKGLSYDPVGGICNWAAGVGCKE